MEKKLNHEKEINKKPKTIFRIRKKVSKSFPSDKRVFHEF